MYVHISILYITIFASMKIYVSDMYIYENDYEEHAARSFYIQQTAWRFLAQAAAQRAAVNMSAGVQKRQRGGLPLSA